MRTSAAVEMQTLGAAAHRRNREARDAVVNAARMRFGLPTDMRTADVLWYLASELREGASAVAA